MKLSDIDCISVILEKYNFPKYAESICAVQTEKYCFKEM